MPHDKQTISSQSGAEEQLPAQHLRQIIGSWRMDFPRIKMNRSIEYVDDKYYLVSRVIEDESTRIGGDTGMLIRKISEVEYHGTGRNLSIYRIAKTGDLESYIRGETEPTMRGTRCTELWPN